MTHPSAAFLFSAFSLLGQQYIVPIIFSARRPHAGEILSVVQTAMMGKLPYTALRDAVFTHPTMAEGLGSLFGGVPTRAQTGATTCRGLSK